MKKANITRIIALVLVLCVLPVAALAQTFTTTTYRPGGQDTRWVITVQYKGASTTVGGKTTLLEYKNTGNKAKPVSYSFSAQTSWSLSKLDMVDKSWLSGRSSDYGQKVTVTLNVNVSIPAGKTLKVYKRIDTTAKKWYHSFTYQYKDHDDPYWINDRQFTGYSTEKHMVPVFWYEIK